ncbi:endonuclease/exonuclease/phosphatase domain-containing protein, putative [Eimeria brunetti]|uniref:Endonuclease/exonuclease/phosphatase domain-containing protein, putative n=1 Tax=Eimeria brunetti TaxID=51314 RepID=U6LBH4_9EIME|nr:endonuclease/exonuclease/phosphatase domain-containing protein, putative [Eimeria brunetti]
MPPFSPSTQTGKTPLLTLGIRIIWRKRQKQSLLLQRPQQQQQREQQKQQQEQQQEQQEQQQQEGRVVRTLPGVSLEAVEAEGGLLSAFFPSDHLPIAADLMVKNE